MVVGLDAMRRSRRFIGLSAGLLLVGMLAPAAVYAKSQSRAQVVYFDPLAMTPQAKMASQAARQDSLAGSYAALDAYPETSSRSFYASGVKQEAAPTRIQTSAIVQKNYVKIGAPYQMNGTWYVPASEPDYDEIGVASWYGDDFHGKATANGEAFDMDVVTAASPTLPLPSIVEVTNLENGRVLKVRVNDRGPFVKGRLIDLSRKGAQELGYYGKGSAKVRVRYVGPAGLDDGQDNLATTSSRSYASSGFQDINYQPSGDLGARTALARSGLPPVDNYKSLPQRPSAALVKAKPIPPLKRAGRYLQIGAFSSYANANSLIFRVSSENGAQIKASSDAGKPIYRVMMGPLSDEASVALARAKAAKAGIIETRLVIAD